MPVPTFLRPMRYYPLYFFLSLAVIVPGVYSLVTRGLKLGIDFTGGSRMVIAGEFDRQQFENQAKELGVTISEAVQEGEVWTIVTSPQSSDQHSQLLPKSAVELSYDSVGPTLGAELIKKTIYGLTLAGFLILCYIAYRFRSIRYGTSAILAMLHDLLVVVGVFSLLGYVIDTLFVTALLTILSFSVHDTIVVYDRIRELKKKYGYLDFDEIVNRAVIETMSRSLNNSMTIIFMLLSLYFLGGDTIRHFVFALLVGTISGTYSSTFTAAPLLVVWDKLARRMKS